MPLPITLPTGAAAIYGTGYYTPVTPHGVILQTNQRVGTVYHIWDGGQNYVYQGVAIFEEGKHIARFATATATWTIINFAQLAIEATEAPLP